MKARTGKRARKTAKTPSRRARKDAIPRSTLAKEVQRQINRFGLTREVAGFVLGDAATQVSRLMQGHVGEFSADRLVKMLTKLGSDVTITVRHSAKLGRRGKVRIKSS